MKSKKAIFFNISLVFITLVVLTTAFILLDSGRLKDEVEKTGQDYNIGKKQFHIIDQIQEAEKLLFYIDHSANLAAQQSAFDLAANGGFETQSICNQYLEYNLWRGTDPERNCYPYDLNEAFIKNFKDNFKPFLDQLLKQEPRIIKTGDYEYSLIMQDNKLNIIGIAKKVQTFYTYFESDKIKSEYTVYPSFAQEINYNFDEYDLLANQAVDLIRKCRDKEDLRECLKTLPEGWILGTCEGAKTITQQRNVAFCVTSKQRLLSATGYQPITYKFALYFPEPEEDLVDLLDIESTTTIV